ncbi:MAG: transposase [Bacteroidia bacterium]|nr:transposase [Bacteroidia bacterium]
MKKHREKYDSYITYLYATGQEEKLPLTFRREIPYTTISNWRKEHSKKFKGSEYRDLHDQAFRVAGLEDKNRRLKQQMRSILRSYLSLRNILGPVIRKSGNDSDTQREVLSAIRYLIEVAGVHAALRIIGISRTQFQQWKLESQYKCFDSFISLCTKRHPHQLSLEEVEMMKRWMSKPELEHWPLSSIAAQALRKGSIIASLYSWYKYAKLVGHERKKWKKKSKGTGVITTYPNEYLHLDATQVDTISMGRVYICFIMDNFSRMILGYSIARKKRFSLVIDALKNALEVLMKHPNHDDVNLVTDGGRENNNKDVSEFLSRLSGIKMKKITAVHGFIPSNNPVEVIHRVMKSCYLNRRSFVGTEDLDLYLQAAVKEYNEVRPHYRHRPLTPREVYFNIPLKFSVRRRMRNAARKRLKVNRCGSCIQCKKPADCSNSRHHAHKPDNQHSDNLLTKNLPSKVTLVSEKPEMQ